jgi:hypothetical protein
VPDGEHPFEMTVLSVCDYLASGECCDVVPDPCLQIYDIVTLVP